MSDIDLLKLAAKAAGIAPLCFDSNNNAFKLGNNRPDFCKRSWNPLTDDSDALRLAVVLQISLAMNQPVGGVEAWCGKNGFFTREKFNDKCDATVATRRAIVRAAAEIGKAMP